MEELKLITTIHYLTGEPNEEFWALLETLRKDGKLINSDWNGDYYVSSYDYQGYRYQYWENMEYGIPSSIEKYSVSTN